MMPLKLLGGPIIARGPDRQTARIQIRIPRGCARTSGACSSVMNR